MTGRVSWLWQHPSCSFPAVVRLAVSWWSIIGWWWHHWIPALVLTHAVVTKYWDGIAGMVLQGTDSDPKNCNATPSCNCWCVITRAAVHLVMQVSIEIGNLSCCQQCQPWPHAQPMNISSTSPPIASASAAACCSSWTGSGQHIRITLQRA